MRGLAMRGMHRYFGSLALGESSVPRAVRDVIRILNISKFWMKSSPECGFCLLIHPLNAPKNDILDDELNFEESYFPHSKSVLNKIIWIGFSFCVLRIANTCHDV